MKGENCNMLLVYFHIQVLDFFLSCFFFFHDATSATFCTLKQKHKRFQPGLESSPISFISTLLYPRPSFWEMESITWSRAVISISSVLLKR